MILGFNTDITYKGIVFHVQTEDKGLRNPKVETLVYKGGSILFAKTTPYDEIINTENQQEIVQALMEEQHHQILEDARSGKFYKGDSKKEDEEKETFRLDLIKEDKSLDELIVDYLCKKHGIK